MISEELQASANEALLKMLEGIEKAGDFAVEQTPLVIRELLLWNGIMSGLYFVLGIALLVAATIFYSKRLHEFSSVGLKQEALKAYERGDAWTRYRENSNLTSIKFDKIMNNDNFDYLMVNGIICGFTAIAGVVFTLNNLIWLKILVAPRLYLLEYAANLVK